MSGPIVDSAQLAAIGVALISAPALVAVHAALRGSRLGLAAAAAVHAVAWVLGCWVAAVAVGGFGAADWLAGAAALGALWLGWFQVYSTLCRGFSMQLLVELESGPSSARGLAGRYAGGRGVDWLLEKRLSGLDAGQLIDDDGDALRSTPRGQRLARISAIYKTLVGIGAGG